MTIKVTSQVPVYEQQGNKVSNLYGAESPYIVVGSHWNDRDMVHLFIADSRQPANTPIDIVVLADDLIAAVVNAQRTGKRW
jgi:hypothetical protein